MPSRYSKGSVLENLGLPANVLADLSELDGATNERKTAERGGCAAISSNELLFGVTLAPIVNAAFCHPGLDGGRFHGPHRGAWYAGFEWETAIEEVAFHRRRFLQDSRIKEEQVYDYVDFQADFFGSFHQLEPAEQEACLQPSPIPQCYRASQALAASLLYKGSNGIVYLSVRRKGGTCIACFRPASVFYPRRSSTYSLTLQAFTDLLSIKEMQLPMESSAGRVS